MYFTKETGTQTNNLPHDRQTYKPQSHPEAVLLAQNETAFGWLVVFNGPSTARSFRDGTPIYCLLQRT